MAFRQLLGSCVSENIKTFCVSMHQAVFDSVVYHLHEVAGAGRSAIKIALFGCAAEFFPARSAWNITHARSEGFEDGIKALHGFFWAAKHHAVSALQPPDAAAGADVDVMNAAVFQLLRPAHVIFIVRVATIDNDVACLETLG